MPFTKEQLYTRIKQDGASLIGTYAVDTRDTNYTFICGCSAEGKKSGRRIIETGALCRKCTQKHNCEKGNQTRYSKLTDTEKQQKVLLEQANKDKSEHETELRAWRDGLLSSRTIIPNVWYTHPVFKNYQANTNGEVRNIERQKIITGSSYANGRTTVSINHRKKQKHRIIMECLLNQTLSDEFEVDHIDTNPGNNLYSNLQILTKKEHAHKTVSDNPLRGIKAQVLVRKPIKCTEFDEYGNIIQESYYESIQQASTQRGIDRKVIRRAIKGTPDKLGNKWELCAKEELVISNEIWKPCYNCPGLLVSNKGRVESTLIDNPSKTYGSLNSNDEYYTVYYKNKVYKVHNLVCATFNEQQPSNNHTVDHIDRNSLNNCADNLRWASTTEQANNRSTVREIEVYNVFTQQQIETFKNQKDCCTSYNVKPSIVSSILRADELKTLFRLGKHKNLSVRYLSLSTEQKIKRELAILEHELHMLTVDKNKRKSNPENLPIHILHPSVGSYHLKITFRNVQTSMTAKSLAEIIEIKNQWINAQKNYWTNQIMLGLTNTNKSDINVITHVY